MKIGMLHSSIPKQKVLKTFDVKFGNCILAIDKSKFFEF